MYGSEMHISALSCKMEKSKACCKMNYTICKYVLITLLECCAMLCMMRKMYEHGNYVQINGVYVSS
jgi:hypothetical protein